MPESTSTLVILGASGDLTHRLLLPGLGSLLRNGPGLDVQLIGAAADDLTAQQWHDRVREGLNEGGCPTAKAAAVAAATRFVQLDVTDLPALSELLHDITEPGRPIVLYFALPPAISMRACEVLAQLDLPSDLRLAIEKPFGSSLATAEEFNRLLTRIVPEERIFRVDHYLGKSMVLNLMGLRYGNRIFEPVWNSTNIESVDIVIDEQLALEGRAGYYDGAGALRDMIQSHLLLVLAIFAMEDPARIDAVELRDLMRHTLRQTRVWEGDGAVASRRARYTAGLVGGRAVPNYVDEPGVDPNNQTETLAEVVLEIRNARWTGVPFRLRSGKALGDGVRAIIVKFRDMPYVPEGFMGAAPANVLVIGMAPESIFLTIATNGAGHAWDFEETQLHAQLGTSPLRPYGEILEGILTGDPLLSVRGDIAEECWRIMTPVLEAWDAGTVPMDEYQAGWAGPTNWT